LWAEEPGDIGEQMIVLVVAAHPDDEVLGCGGTTARLRNEGHTVVYERIIGKGRGDGYDQRFDAIDLMVHVEQIEAWIAELQPEIVYSHWLGDVNRDHQIIAEAVGVATRPLPWCPVREVYAFEIQGDGAFVPDVWVTLMESEITNKVERMLVEYKSEMRDWPHPRSEIGITLQASFRGMQCGHEYAEAFRVVRIVR